MWEGIEARIEENDKEREVPFRRSLLEILRNSDVRAGQGATKKMVALEFGKNERLLWQLEGTAEHFYLHQKWQSHIEAAGFQTKPFPHSKPDGGRHSALDFEWSFRGTDCIQVRLGSADAWQKLMHVLLP